MQEYHLLDIRIARRVDDLVVNTFGHIDHPIQIARQKDEKIDNTDIIYRNTSI